MNAVLFYQSPDVITGRTFWHQITDKEIVLEYDNHLPDHWRNARGILQSNVLPEENPYLHRGIAEAIPRVPLCLRGSRAPILWFNSYASRRVRRLSCLH
jgi:hypothetical protein